jgi:hypothetical protein
MTIQEQIQWTTEFEQEQHDSSHEAENTTASNVATEILNNTLQVKR